MSEPLWDKKPGTPRWVIVIAVAFACTQPLLILWFIGRPPEGLVSSGLHIPDSALFLHSMDMFRSGFESLYAAGDASLGTQHYSYFPLPHLWLYGALGWLSDYLPISDFVTYGLAGGLGTFLYLMAAYHLLREIAAKDADRAFLLFSLSGGLGGVLYIATGALGWHASPHFEDYFIRYAMYELFEGAHLQPFSFLARFYYTLSLALCLGALTLLIRGVRRGTWRPLVGVALALPFGVFIDLRYGVFTVALAFLFLYCEDDVPVRRRLHYAGRLRDTRGAGRVSRVVLAAKQSGRDPEPRRCGQPRDVSVAVPECRRVSPHRRAPRGGGTRALYAHVDSDGGDGRHGLSRGLLRTVLRLPSVSRQRHRGARRGGGAGGVGLGVDRGRGRGVLGVYAPAAQAARAASGLGRPVVPWFPGRVDLGLRARLVPAVWTATHADPALAPALRAVGGRHAAFVHRAQARGFGSVHGVDCLRREFGYRRHAMLPRGRSAIARASRLTPTRIPR